VNPLCDFDLAVELFRAYRSADNTAALATVSAARDVAKAKLVGGADRLEVTSFTLNGQQAAGEMSMSLGEQLLMLNRLHKMLTDDAAGSSRTVPSFT